MTPEGTLLLMLASLVLGFVVGYLRGMVRGGRLMMSYFDRKYRADGDAGVLREFHEWKDERR